MLPSILPQLGWGLFSLHKGNRSRTSNGVLLGYHLAWATGLTGCVFLFVGFAKFSNIPLGSSILLDTFSIYFESRPIFMVKDFQYLKLSAHFPACGMISFIGPHFSIHRELISR
jgi:hypothetical protein